MASIHIIERWRGRKRARGAKCRSTEEEEEGSQKGVPSQVCGSGSYAPKKFWNFACRTVHFWSFLGVVCLVQQCQAQIFWRDEKILDLAQNFYSGRRSPAPSRPVGIEATGPDWSKCLASAWVESRCRIVRRGKSTAVTAFLVDKTGTIHHRYTLPPPPRLQFDDADVHRSISSSRSQIIHCGIRRRLTRLLQTISLELRKRPKSLLTEKNLPKSPNQNHKRCVTKSPNKGSTKITKRRRCERSITLLELNAFSVSVCLFLQT